MRLLFYIGLAVLVLLAIIFVIAFIIWSVPVLAFMAIIAGCGALLAWREDKALERQFGPDR
jgi:hypothetical protein